MLLKMIDFNFEIVWLNETDKVLNMAVHIREDSKTGCLNSSHWKFNQISRFKSLDALQLKLTEIICFFFVQFFQLVYDPSGINCFHKDQETILLTWRWLNKAQLHLLVLIWNPRQCKKLMVLQIRYWQLLFIAWLFLLIGARKLLCQTSTKTSLNLQSLLLCKT